MSNVIPIPTALKRRSDRVDALCAAVAHGKAVRPIATAHEVDGAVCLEVGDLEVWLSPEDALELSNQIATTAGDALGKRRSR